MIALHYRLPLPIDFDMTRIRSRVADRHGVFDTHPGLAMKAFLIREAATAGANLYGTFYVWRDPAAATGFLLGDLFGAVSAGFGRPSAEPWLIAEHAWRRDGMATSAIQTLAAVPEGHSVAAVAAAARAPHDALDPLSVTICIDPGQWRVLVFSLLGSAPDATAVGPDTWLYEVLHVSRPDGG